MTATPSAPFANPLSEEGRHVKAVDPCVMVIFGSTGDLTGRKLLPALYNLANDGELPARFACVGFARRDKSHEQFRSEMHSDIAKFSRTQPIDEEVWKTFASGLYYHRAEFDNDAGYESLRQFLDELDQRHGTAGNRLYYLSTPPRYFPLIIEKLSQHELIYPYGKGEARWSRIIIEKPFGQDLPSALALQNHINRYLSEEQIYRIDHYLGKETVQNLLNFRFTNPIFEALWNNRHIDHIQITVSEELGIGTRGHFFEEAGTLRDIVQNHMMQLLSLVAMEPPNNLKAASIRNEKVKVMEAIRPLTQEGLAEVVRGQYGPGFIGQQAVIGYREEQDVAADSNVETYVALELHIDNWRWAGVPFFLRAGKRMPKRTTEIAIIFRCAPDLMHQSDVPQAAANAIVIRIQPDEGISLKFNCKVPGLYTLLQPVKMDFLYGCFFNSTPPEAYERLLCDCIAGDNTLFASADEVMASWRLFTPLLDYWHTHTSPPFPNYAAGSWGPSDADNLIGRSGRHWRLV